MLNRPFHVTIPMLMKNTALMVLLFWLMADGLLAQQSGVSINDNSAPPHESAILDLQSDNKGLLPPRMTTAERDAIVNPANGLMIFNTVTNCINYRVGAVWYEVCGTPPAGEVSALDCEGAAHSGTLSPGVAAIGVNSEVAYTGGNGFTHGGQTVNSTGISGLTATLTPGSFANGGGTLTYTITGTPSGAGTASFALSIGGQTCTLTRTVSDPPYDGTNCGTGVVSFTYKGENVTYGTVLSSNSTCWLDRNLGASQVATSSTDEDGYGDLFQWGRGDDGHQNRNSGTTATLSSGDDPGNGNFITIQSGNDDWRSPQNANLWQGVNGTNNPCPDGWRVPAEAELEAERTSWNNSNAAGAFASPLKLPMAGRRVLTTGSLGSLGATGYYWSSSASGIYSRALVFVDSEAFMDTGGRAWGYSVRCIKD
jgi:hypothetical protein